MRQAKRSKNNNLGKVDVVILCGGEGKRLRGLINDRPKVLAPVGGKTFLELIIENLKSHGFERIILSVGYLKEQIIDYFRGREDIKIEFSSEDAPLGTGGALKRAKNFIKSEHFLVLNGDCLCPVDFEKFHRNHLDKQAMISMVVLNVEDISDYGSIKLEETGKVADFREKNFEKERGLINGGVYLMSKDIFYFMPEEDYFSLEYDLFPRILDKSFHGFMGDGELIDIGTPEKYQKTIRYFLNQIDA